MPLVCIFRTSEISRYLSMIKTDIMGFVSNNRYNTLSKVQEHATRREIELETQIKEKGQTLALSQLTAKIFKHTASRYGG